jgi:hypothetical protein
MAFVREARNYVQFMEALRDRCADLDVAYETVDVMAGLPARYLAKVLAPVPIKALGPVSLGPMLGAMGLKVLVVEDAETLARFAKKLSKRKYRRHAGVGMPANKRHRKSALSGNSDWGKMMRARQIAQASPTQRKQSAKKAAKARWRKPRVVEITPAESASATPAPAAPRESAARPDRPGKANDA